MTSDLPADGQALDNPEGFLRILIYSTFQPFLDKAKKAIGALHKDALDNVIFENDPDVVGRRLAGLAGSGEPFVLVCGNRLFPRIWGFAHGGELAVALKNLNPKAYVAVLSPNPAGALGADERLERDTPDEDALFVRLALLATGRIKRLNPNRKT